MRFLFVNVTFCEDKYERVHSLRECQFGRRFVIKNSFMILFMFSMKFNCELFLNL